MLKDIDGVTIKPSVESLDEIMQEQVINYTRPPIIGIKSNHSMLDIDKISLNCGIGNANTGREAVKLATKSLDTIREIRDSGKEKPEVYELSC